MQSPIGLLPKGTDKTRLIFHLSYDFGEADCDRSFNCHTPDELCSVKYFDLDHAISSSLDLCKHNWSKSIYYAKTDVTSAFRQLPGLPRNYRWLMMAAEDPISGKKVYFLDKVIPFGASRSCVLFQAFSNGLRFIVESTWEGPRSF